jgi:hypothetical protein
MDEMRELLEHVARGDATRESIPSHLQDAFAEAERRGWIRDAGTSQRGHGNLTAAPVMTHVVLEGAGEAELARLRSGIT